MLVEGYERQHYPVVPVALDDAKIRAAKAMLAGGTMSAGEVAKQLGVAPSTLYRHLPGGLRAASA